MKIFRDKFNKNFKFFAAFILGSYVFSCCNNLAYAKKVEIEKADEIKSKPNKKNKNNKEKETKTEKNVKNKEKDSKEKENEEEIEIEKSSNSQEVIKDYKNGKIDTSYFFDKNISENKNKKPAKDPEKGIDDVIFSYKLKTNFESNNINYIAGIILWQAILDKVCNGQSETLKDEQYLLTRSLKSMRDSEEKNCPEIRMFESLTDYLKNKLSTETWQEPVIDKTEFTKSKNGKLYPYFIDTIDSIADSFNIKAEKYCKTLSKKTPEKAIEEVISQAKETTKYFIKKYKDYIKPENYKKIKKEFMKSQIKKYKDEIKYLTNRLTLLKEYKKDNNLSEFKKFLKDRVLPYEENEKKKVAKWVESLNKSKEDPENKNIKGWFEHLLARCYNVEINDAIIKGLKRIISNEEKLKDYFNSCIKEAEQKLATTRSNLTKTEKELNKLEKTTQNNDKTLSKDVDVKDIKYSYKKEIKALDAWFKKIDKKINNVDKDKFEKILEKLNLIEPNKINKSVIDSYYKEIAALDSLQKKIKINKVYKEELKEILERLNLFIHEKDIIDSYKIKIKALENWLKKIDEVNKDELKKLLKNLKPVKMVFLGGPEEQPKG